MLRRPNRDEYFMGISKFVASRSTCPRAQVGAIVVNSSNRIVGTGYNGSPPGHIHCLDVGCKIIKAEGKEYCIRTIHAEVNALLTVDSIQDRLTMYSTHFPCFECIKVMVSKGITTVKYMEEYRDPKWKVIQNEYTQISFIRI